MRSSRLRIDMKVVLCIGCFVTAAAAADISTTRLVSLGGDSLDAARLGRLIRGDDPNEIPIFGASKARYAYDPEILGPSFFNYGFDATSLDVLNVMLTFELRKRSTQPILIDLHHQGLHGVGDVRTYVPYVAEDEIAKLLVRERKMIWRYRIFGLRYFGLFDGYVKGAISSRLRSDKPSRGFASEQNAKPSNASQFAANVEKRSKTVFHMGFDENQKRRLIELISSAPDRKFILTFCPLHRSWFATVSGEEDFLRELDEIARLPNVHILDFSRDAYSDDQFVDTGHLNAAGAAVFSRRLKAALQQLDLYGVRPVASVDGRR
jgi:hypothetical protein